MRRQVVETNLKSQIKMFSKTPGQFPAVTVATRLSILYQDVRTIYSCVATKSEVLSEASEKFPDTFMAIKPGIFNGTS